MNRTRHSREVGGMVGLLVVLFVLACPQRTSAQFVAPSDFQDSTANRFLLDYATFATPDSNLIRLEVYYQIFNKGLDFVEKDGQYVADYELAISVDDDDGNRVQTISRNRQVVLNHEEVAKSRFDFRTSQVNFDLPKGKYKIQFILRDRNNDKIVRREADAELDRLLDPMELTKGGIKK